MIFLRLLAFMVLILPVCPEKAFSQEQLSAVEQMQRLDQVIAPAGSLARFLENSEIQNEYFQELQIYYGKEKFSREAYDAILKQLKELTVQVPEISTRLWETTNLGTRVEVETNIQTSGRSLDQRSWDQFYSDWSTTVKEDASPLLKLNDDEIKNRVIAYQKRYQSALANAEAENASISSKTKRQEAMAVFFKKERALPETQLIAAYFLDQYLSQDLNQDAFRSGDADIILDALDFLRQNLKSSFRSGNSSEDLPSPVLSQIKNYLPTKENLLKDETIFPIITREARDGKLVPVGSAGIQKYTFDPIPRRIHGIWKGVSLGECVGGGSVHYLTPERWATIALHETQLLNAHQGTSYLGFIQVAPLGFERKTYGSVDFGAGVLSRKIIQRKTNGLSSNSVLFDLWYQAYQEVRPKSWSGLVVSDSEAIGNAKVLPSVWDSPTYRFGIVLGKSKAFQIMDPIYEKIVAASPKNALAKRYGGRMIFDGVVKDAKNLTRLGPVQRNLYENSRKMIAGLKNGNLDYQKKLLLGLESSKTHAPNDVLIEVFRFLPSRNKDISFAANALVIQTLKWNPELFRTQVMNSLQKGSKKQNLAMLTLLSEQKNIPFPEVRIELEKTLHSPDPVLRALARKSIIANEAWSPELSALKASLLASIDLKTNSHEFEILVKQFSNHRDYPVQATARVIENFQVNPGSYPWYSVAYLSAAPISSEQIATLRKIAVSLSRGPSECAIKVLMAVDSNQKSTLSILRKKWVLAGTDFYARSQVIEDYQSKFGTDDQLEEWFLVLANDEFNSADQNVGTKEKNLFKILDPLLSRPKMRAFALLQATQNPKYQIREHLLNVLTETDLNEREAMIFLRAKDIWSMPQLPNLVAKLHRPSSEFVSLFLKIYLDFGGQSQNNRDTLDQIISGFEDSEKIQIVDALRQNIVESFQKRNLTTPEHMQARRVYELLGNSNLKIPFDLQNLAIDYVSRGQVSNHAIQALFNFDLTNPELKQKIQALYENDFLSVSPDVFRLEPKIGPLSKTFKSKIQKYVNSIRKYLPLEEINHYENLAQGIPVAYPCDAVIANGRPN